MSNKFDSNPKSFCLSRIFRKQETNKGQLISWNRQENEPGPYATAEKSLPTEKSLRSNTASQYITQKFGQISENFDFRFHSHCSCIVIRRANQIGNWNSIIPEFLPATNRWQRAVETLGSRLAALQFAPFVYSAQEMQRCFVVCFTRIQPDITDASPAFPACSLATIQRNVSHSGRSEQPINNLHDDSQWNAWRHVSGHVQFLYHKLGADKHGSAKKHKSVNCFKLSEIPLLVFHIWEPFFTDFVVIFLLTLDKPRRFYMRFGLVFIQLFNQ